MAPTSLQPSKAALRRLVTQLKNGSASSMKVVDGAVEFSGEISKDWTTAVSNIAEQSEVRKRVSRSHVESRLRAVLPSVLNEDSKPSVVKMVDDLVEEFSGWRLVHIVHVPLDGLTVRVRRLRIGGVTVLPPSSTYPHRLLRQLSRNRPPLAAATPDSEQKRIDWEQRFLADWQKEVGDLPFLRCEVMAEAHRAMEIAAEIAGHAIDLLTALSYSVAPLADRTAVRFAGEQTAGSRRTLALAVDLSSRSSHVRLVGRPLALELDRSSVRWMRTNHWCEFAACTIGSEVNPTELDAALQRAMRWFAIGAGQDDKSVAFVSLSIALETMFPPQNDSISSALADGISWLIGKKAAGRHTVWHLLKDLYKTRSGIVHGRAPDVSDEDIDTLRHYLRVVFRQLLLMRKRLRTRDELRNWVLSRKLRGLPDPPTGGNAPDAAPPVGTPSTPPR
jgi:hypothetical protein